MLSFTQTLTTFVKGTFSKSIVFKVNNTFEPNVLKLVIKMVFINSNLFSFLIINVKILSNFQKEWCTFGRKKKCLKKTRTVHFQSLNPLTCKNTFDLCQALGI